MIEEYKGFGDTQDAMLKGMYGEKLYNNLFGKRKNYYVENRMVEELIWSAWLKKDILSDENEHVRRATIILCQAHALWRLEHADDINAAKPMTDEEYNEVMEVWFPEMLERAKEVGMDDDDYQMFKDAMEANGPVASKEYSMDDIDRIIREMNNK